MRIGVISDIHANLEALSVVLRGLELESIDRIVCLGDMVGYGPNPNECCEIVRSREIESVVGNHDMAVVGKLPPDWFNLDARRAIEWTAEQISEVNRDYLGGLPERRILDSWELAHGSPEDPSTYMISLEDACAAFELVEKNICFFGHTHVACFFEQSPDGSVEGFQNPDGGRLELKSGHRYLINPGSVGQPRDGNPRCGFAVYDAEAMIIEFARSEYAIAETQAKMQKAGLPDALWRRLEYGW